MEIGEYIRLDNGYIYQWENNDYEWFYEENGQLIYGNGAKEYEWESNIMNHSFDIIDLIEPQDLMYIDIDNGYAGGIVVPRVAETIGELEKYIDSFKNKETTLVGIVTHEQLNNRMYKVVE